MIPTFLLLSVLVGSSVSWAFRPPHFSRHLWAIEGKRLSGAARIDFIHRYFSDMEKGFEWRLEREYSDSTHVHSLHDLYFQGRRVLGVSLKTHYSRKGGIDYATHTWDRRIDPGKVKAIQWSTLERTRQFVRQSMVRRFGRFEGWVGVEPVVWVPEWGGEAVNALDVKVSDPTHGLFDRTIIDEENGETLESKKVLRSLDVNSKAYKINPDRKALESVTLTGLNNSTSLSNGYFNVTRVQVNSTSAKAQAVDVNPGVDFSSVAGFSSDPESYNATCEGSSNSSCPNQAFDAVNVYFHVNGYREKLQSYFQTLAFNTSVFSDTGNKNDPLYVFVNFVASNQSNNAFFNPQPCSDPPTIPKCLLFLKPATVSEPQACKVSSSKFFDLAREALVIVHEYQHYITDTLARLEPGSGTKNVGDALHEGYSDYFAASHISHTSGENVTKIGEYSFSNCTPLIRELATLTPYQNTTAFEDEHLAGLTWASGLWKLRTDIGREVTDLIALKSLLLLSTKPGFVEAVEALVKADELLYSGTNRGRIRSLFYDQLNFIGGQTGIFRDTENLVPEIGFRSCASIPLRGASSLNSLLSALWLVLTLWIGKRRGRR